VAESAPTAVVAIRRGRARPLWAGHPWIFASSVDRVEGSPADGDLVEVRDDAGRFLARGFWNGRSLLRVRVLTLRADHPPLADLVAERVRRAVALRRDAGVPAATEAWRAVHGEGDFLPGVVADAFGPFVVLQVSVKGMEALVDPLAAALARECGARGVWLRGGARHADREGVVEGEDRAVLGEEPPETAWCRESGTWFGVDIRGGQKTGHFADQRENRLRFAAACAGRSVLDAFSATGGFGLVALVRGAASSVLALDGSAPALERLLANADRNGVRDRVSVERGDAFLALRRLEGSGRRFGAVSVDPPRMADRKGAAEGALKAHRELHLRALLLLEEGGVLATSSCSGAVSEEAFLETLREAARMAKRRIQVLHLGGAGPDHPWSPVHPEGRYLSFLLARVTAFS
jgi:23S rRNA (cytosine1962-C5)-methyltransferase